MLGFTRRDWRPYHRQITFGVALALVLISLALTMLSMAETGVAQPIDAAAFTVLPGEYQSPDRCRACHEAEFTAWSGTTHADASFDPIFQTFLQDAEQPGECFGCHATGYDINTGLFVLAGVSCEACHGPYRPEHPTESMAIAASEELCGHCHTSTLLEWKSSRHGEVGVNCVACHEVHTQRTRQDAATNALCANCHQNRIQDDTHRHHLVADVRCIFCHLSRPPINGDRAVNGHAPTAHAFTVVVSTCSECHEGISSPAGNQGQTSLESG